MSFKDAASKLGGKVLKSAKSDAKSFGFKLANKGYDATIWLIQKVILFTVVFIAIWLILIFRESTKDLHGKCYQSMDIGQTTTFVLDASKIKGIGKRSSLSELGSNIGQSPVDWIDTGMVTTGDIVEVYVSGVIYPWGEDATDKIYTPVRSIGGGFDMKKTTPICPMSDNIANDSYCKYGIDKVSGNCQYPESDEFRRNNIRYDNVSCDSEKIPLSEQNSYIKGIHYEPIRVESGKPQGCNSFSNIVGFMENSDKMDIGTCALANGAGLYMKLGSDAKIAYHVRNVEVDMMEKVSPGISETLLAPNVNQFGARKTVTMPFMLPTMGYNYKKVLEDNPQYQNITVSEYIEPIDIVSDTRYNKLEFFGPCPMEGLRLGNGENTSKLTPNECEGSYAPGGKRIYLMVSVQDFTNLEGKYHLDFKRGAKYAGASDFGILAAVWKNMVFDTYGIDAKRNTLDEDGVIIQVRNKVVTSIQFRALTVMLLTMFLCWLGFQILTGSQSLSATIIMVRLIEVGFATWATDLENYAMIDEVILPIFFTGANDFMGMLIDTMFRISGVSSFIINKAEPFTSMDSVLGDIFSAPVMAKLMGMFNEGGAFIFFPTIVLWLLISVYIYIIKTSMVFIISTLAIGSMIMLFPIAVTGMFWSDKFKGWIQKNINTMMQNAMSSLGGVLVFTIALGLIFFHLKIMLGYKVCFENLRNVMGPASLYGWKAKGLELNDVIRNTVFLYVTLTIAADANGFVKSLGASLFGKTDDALGKNLFDKVFDTTIGNASKLATSTLSGMGIKANVSVSSKDLDDPMGAMKRATVSLSQPMQRGVKRLAVEGKAAIKDKWNQTVKPKANPKANPLAPGNKGGGAGGGAGGNDKDDDIPVIGNDNSNVSPVASTAGGKGGSGGGVDSSGSAPDGGEGSNGLSPAGASSATPSGDSDEDMSRSTGGEISNAGGGESVDKAGKEVAGEGQAVLPNSKAGSGKMQSNKLDQSGNSEDNQAKMDENGSENGGEKGGEKGGVDRGGVDRGGVDRGGVESGNQMGNKEGRGSVSRLDKDMDDKESKDGEPGDGKKKKGEKGEDKEDSENLSNHLQNRDEKGEKDGDGKKKKGKDEKGEKDGENFSDNLQNRDEKGEKDGDGKDLKKRDELPEKEMKMQDPEEEKKDRGMLDKKIEETLRSQFGDDLAELLMEKLSGLTPDKLDRIMRILSGDLSNLTAEDIALLREAGLLEMLVSAGKISAEHLQKLEEDKAKEIAGGQSTGEVQGIGVAESAQGIGQMGDKNNAVGSSSENAIGEAAGNMQNREADEKRKKDEEIRTHESKIKGLGTKKSKLQNIIKKYNTSPGDDIEGLINQFIETQDPQVAAELSAKLDIKIDPTQLGNMAHIEAVAQVAAQKAMEVQYAQEKLKQVEVRLKREEDQLKKLKK